MRTSVLMVVVSRPEIRLSQSGPCVLRRRGRSGINASSADRRGTFRGGVRLAQAIRIVEIDSTVAIVVDAVSARRPRDQLARSQVDQRVLADTACRRRFRDDLTLSVRGLDSHAVDVQLLERE